MSVGFEENNMREINPYKIQKSNFAVLLQKQKIGSPYSYLSTFENTRSGDFLPAKLIAGNFRTPDLPLVFTA